MTDMFQLAVRYLRATHPIRMLMHLIWLFCVLSMLSFTYIFTFHFQPVIELWQKSQSVNHFAHELQSSLAIDTKIIAELNLLLASSNANRAYVFRYHNGTPSVNNVPFVFNTNTHEVIKPGTSRVIQFGQHLPSSLNLSMNTDFLQRKCVILNNLSNNPEGSNYWYYQTRNAKAMIRCAFFSEKGDLLGFIGVDYTDTVTDSFLKNTERQVKESSDIIGRVFDLIK